MKAFICTVVFLEFMTLTSYLLVKKNEDNIKDSESYKFMKEYPHIRTIWHAVICVVGVVVLAIGK